jgi:hypothetical protein
LQEEKNMTDKFHGVFSLLLILAAVVIALVYMLDVSAGWGFCYIAVIVIANPIVLSSYCAKCLCREDGCSHVIPGKLTRLLPARKPGPYSFWDYLATAISLAVLVGFPQFWLWRSKAVLVLFWILVTIGLVEILFCVCRSCRNANCPNCAIN